MSATLASVDIVFFWYTYLDMSDGKKSMESDYVFGNKTSDEEIYKYLQDKLGAECRIEDLTVER